MSLKTTTQKNLYSNEGISFRDIVIDGKHGGRKGLKNYLRARIRHLTRTLSQQASSADEKIRIHSAIGAMSDAVLIIDTMSSRPITTP